MRKVYFLIFLLFVCASYSYGQIVITTAASDVTMTTATAGGNVTIDGGNPVTARGTCWGTSVNPDISGSHTSDGTGTGVFPSSLNGLSPGTTYHNRAYATNTAGTVYGMDLSFITYCGTFTLPFSESFSGTTIPGCWSQVDHQGSGQVWQFGTITGYTPAPLLTGNYAYLNSDAYGMGQVQNADLVTPPLDMTGFDSVTLQFNHFFRYNQPSSATLFYSINNGTTWTEIQKWNTISTANPEAFSQVIPALAGQSQVKIKWNYWGPYGYYWAVDDVSITGTSTNPTLTVTPPNQNVPHATGSAIFIVVSNSSWIVSSDQTWCMVNPSGTGDGTITANYGDNPNAALRTANITVTVSGMPPVIVSVNQDGVVGVANKLRDLIQILPNPTTGLFRIVTGNAIDIQQIDLLDLTGRVILSRKCDSKDDYQFDLSNASEGCYFVKMKMNDETRVHRLVITR